MVSRTVVHRLFMVALAALSGHVGEPFEHQFGQRKRGDFPPREVPSEFERVIGVVGIKRPVPIRP